MLQTPGTEQGLGLNKQGAQGAEFMDTGSSDANLHLFDPETGCLLKLCTPLPSLKSWHWPGTKSESRKEQRCHNKTMAKSEKKKASLSNFPRLHSLVKT